MTLHLVRVLAYMSYIRSIIPPFQSTMQIVWGAMTWTPFRWTPPPTKRTFCFRKPYFSEAFLVWGPIFSEGVQPAKSIQPSDLAGGLPSEKVGPHTKKASEK